MVHLDDILIYSDNPQEHEKNVCMVLEKLHTYSLYCKLSKCALDVDTVNFLGFVVSPKGIHMCHGLGLVDTNEMIFLSKLV